MNILVIGNGFDLAHGLPTKYTDFLNFCTVVRKIYEDEKLELRHYKEICLAQCGLNEEIEQQLIKVFDSRKEHKGIDNNSGVIHTFTTKFPRTDELYALIQNNLWIEYFWQCNMYQRENWIDFENEISKVIQTLDSDMHGLNGDGNINDDISSLSNSFFGEKYLEYSYIYRSLTAMTDGIVKRISFKEIRDTLLYDLNRLIRALEIYLCEYVEHIEIQKRSPDIDTLKIDYVLSFNYTHTFSNIYKLSGAIDKYGITPFDYIHGEVNIESAIETNNMVLGIDEYLNKKRKNKEVDFIAFKKFYQRIHKQTGCKYKKWVELIQKDSERENTWIYDSQDHSKDNFHNLYIFGHSIDVTDKDILRDLILNDNVYTTIFYHDKDTMGQQIANLVKVIGQDELIRRTGGSMKTIEFKSQQSMVERRDN